MKRARKESQSGDTVFVGIDLHESKWHVTARTFKFELFIGSIHGRWEALQLTLKPGVDITHRRDWDFL